MCSYAQVTNIDRQFPTDTSRDGCMRVPAAAGSSGTHAAAAAAAQERWHLQGLQQLPWDWSVKLRVRLSSAAPFAVLEEQRTSGLGPGELLGGGRQTARREQQQGQQYQHWMIVWMQV
jgi:hypothetical protein